MMIHISAGIMVLMAPFSLLASLSIFIMLHKFRSRCNKIDLENSQLERSHVLRIDPRMRFVCRTREKQKFVLDLPIFAKFEYLCAAYMPTRRNYL